MIPGEKPVLIEKTARSLGTAPRERRLRHIGKCLKADQASGKGVADAPGVALSEAPA